MVFLHSDSRGVVALGTLAAWSEGGNRIAAAVAMARLKQVAVRTNFITSLRQAKMH